MQEVFVLVFDKSTSNRLPRHQSQPSVVHHTATIAWLHGTVTPIPIGTVQSVARPALTHMRGWDGRAVSPLQSRPGRDLTWDSSIRSMRRLCPSLTTLVSPRHCPSVDAAPDRSLRECVSAACELPKSCHLCQPHIGALCLEATLGSWSAAPREI